MGFQKPLTDAILTQIKERSQFLNTIDDLPDAIFDAITNPIPIGLPSAPTNPGFTVSNNQAALSWTPSPGAISQNIYRAGLPIKNNHPASGLVAGTFIDVALPSGTYSYNIRSVNDYGEESTGLTISVTIGSVSTLAGPTAASPAYSPNGGFPQLFWIPVTDAIGYQIQNSSGTVIDVVNGQSASSWTYNLSGGALTAGSYTFKVATVNAAGVVGSATSFAIVITSTGGSITYTHLGTWEQADATTAVDTITSSSQTVTSGYMLVAIGIQYQGNSNLAWNVPTDTFGDGGTWTPTPLISQVQGVSGDYIQVAYFAKIVGGTGTHTGTVSLQRTPSGTTFWYGKLTLIQVQNYASITPVASNAAVSTTSSVTTDLGHTPGATSLIISAMGDGQADGLAPTEPSGFTGLTNSQPGAGRAAMAVAVLNGSATQTQVWTTTRAYANVAASIEISLGSSGGSGGSPNSPPSAPSNVRYNLIPQPGGLFQVVLAWDVIPGATGFNINLGGTDAAHRVDQQPNNLATSWIDPVLRSPGSPGPTTYSYYISGTNLAGPSTLSLDSVVVTASSGVTRKNFLGWSVEDLVIGSANAWENGGDLTENEAKISVTGSKFFLTWSTTTLSQAQQMVDDAIYYMQPGRALAGKEPVLDMFLGITTATIDQVNNGSCDTNIDALASYIQGKITGGSLTSGHVTMRVAHEFPIQGAFSYSIVNTTASMQSFQTAFRRVYTRMKAICPGLLIELCGFSSGYDYSLAIPWDALDMAGIDMYFDWQGVGSTKINPSDPYSPPADDNAAWNGTWYHGNDPSNPLPGSPAWLWNLGIAHGKKYSFSEWGMIARQTLPTAGFGDWPRGVVEMGNLIDTGNVHHATMYTVFGVQFTNSNTGQTGFQDHYIASSPSHFPNTVTQLHTTFV